MPCNPSIGGTSKGHLVREIDALGGEMGLAADANTLQMRMLNLGKGPAVHSPRAQIDRRAYSAYMKRTLEEQENLTLRQAEIVDIHYDSGEWVLTTRLEAVYRAKCVVLATGTFLGGRVVHLSAQEMLKGNVQMLLDGEWGAILFPFPSLYLVPVWLCEYPGVIAIEGKCLQIVGLVLWCSMAQEDIVHVATYPCGRLVVCSMLTQFALHGGIALGERTEHAHHATFQWGMAVLMVFCEESPLGYICHAM